MNVGNLFPIGTVVTVKDANKSMMIIGVLPENDGTRSIRSSVRIWSRS